MQKQILIADDDPTMRAALGDALGGAGYRTALFASGEEAERHLRQSGADLVVSDVRMPGMSGLDLLKGFPEVPFIMISGFATVPEAVAAMKIGAFDFVVKPFSYRELVSLVEAALARDGGAEPEAAADGGFVATNARMLALLDFARQVARSHASILIHGESGTGKELLARYVHAHSRRSAGPFVAVNCAALPEGLLESELFGHERGAFTGAVASKPGKFELAHGGTLLLDEVSEMPLSLQAKLLRVLQEREVDRVGGKKPLPVDIRVIATTNRDLHAMIRAGTFRQDLFYRLNVVPIRIFPLRERLDDIEPLARAFFATRGYPGARLASEACERLRRHSWRGNVRELFNVLERAAIVAQGGTIEPRHLMLEDEADLLPPPAVETCRIGLAGSSAPGVPELSGGDGAGLSMKEMEERLIFQALKQANGNRTRAARALGISVRTLRNKLKQYRARGAREAVPWPA
ncbi:MAG TPA: sigma-54 dependent transcriptional regulator [candidate division Zixibacteria bacterium]|nr:sigma-54 dependent transcriptional regulator [candidate division Zixibacteria bacterium]